MSGDHNQFQKPKSYLDDMNEVRKALEMALMALENANDMFSDDCSVEDVYADEIKALTKVLEKKSFECPRCGHCCYVDDDDISQDHVDETVKQEHEPVGFFSVNDYGNWEQNENGYGTPLYAAPPKQEPVAWANSFDLQNFDMKVRTGPDLHHTVPLYTAPPKREWVGLTALEIYECWKTGDVVEAVETKLKEKNNG